MPGVRKKEERKPEKMKIEVFVTVPPTGCGFNVPSGVMRNYILDKVQQTFEKYGLTDIGFMVDKA